MFDVHLIADLVADHGGDAASAVLRLIADREPVPFLTGSRAYGVPRVDSDIDIVCLMTVEELDTLRRYENARRAKHGYGGITAYGGEASLRFDAWNLICVTSDRSYAAWRDATAWLIVRRPVMRERAIKLIKYATEVYHQGETLDTLIGEVEAVA